MDIEIRDIKIDMITGSPNPIIDLFNKVTQGIQIVNCDVYNKEGLEFIYHKDGEWIFFQDLKNEKFWCNYDRYWEFFESEIGLGYFEIQSITKFLVEESLKKPVPPIERKTYNVGMVEEALKREVIPPKYGWLNHPRMVEEALKREVIPPIQNLDLLHITVEEALKREVVPPLVIDDLNTNAGKLFLVEEALKREAVPPLFLANDNQFHIKNQKMVEEALKRGARPEKEIGE